MENNFHYTYNAEENQEAQSIRSKYLPREQTGLDKLKELDRKVKKVPLVFACVYGSISAVIMGAGMSLVMTDIGAALNIADPMIPGIGIGLLGMALALTTYPIYKGMLNARKKKYGPQILELSEQIVHN